MTTVNSISLISQDFGGGSIYVTETMKSMVPPHISPTGVKPGFARKAMPPGRKIVPGGVEELPRHATNSKLLKSSLGTGGLSPALGPSPQSSGKIKLSFWFVLFRFLGVVGFKQNHKIFSSSSILVKTKYYHLIR